MVAPPPAFRFSDASPGFLRFLAIMMVFTVGNGFNLVYMISAYPAGVISDRVGQRRVMVAGLAVFALVYFGFGLTTSPFWLIALFLVYGLYQGLTDGNTRAFIADLAPPERRASTAHPGP
jgi:MFS family permease